MKEKRNKNNKPHNDNSILDELFPTYPSSQLNFFGNSLVSSDPWQSTETNEVPEQFPGMVNTKDRG